MLARTLYSAVERIEAPHGAAPTVRNIAVVTDLVDKSNLIHASYHEIDLALSRYLGTRGCSNFFTYAKHAAREAGVQASDADTVLKVVASLRGLSLGVGGVRSSLGSLSAARQLRAVLRRPGVFGKASALVRAKRSVRAIVEALHTLRGCLDLGNSAIYERLAPMFCGFLCARGSSFRVENDVNGLLSAGLAHYARARDCSLQLSGPSIEDVERSKLQSMRKEAVRAGNRLVVFYEQLYIVQPFYDDMREEIATLDGLLTVNHPGGAHRLSRGWADFYPRMGVDVRLVPADPRELRAADFPLAPARSGAAGTITDYFDSNFDNPRLRLPALPITRR